MAFSLLGIHIVTLDVMGFVLEKKTKNDDVYVARMHFCYHICVAFVVSSRCGRAISGSQQPVRSSWPRLVLCVC